MLEERSDLLGCHGGPYYRRLQRLGNSSLHEMLERWGLVMDPANAPLPLVICGHCWWPEVLVELAGGIQVLKVDVRGVALTCA